MDYSLDAVRVSAAGIRTRPCSPRKDLGRWVRVPEATPFGSRARSTEPLDVSRCWAKDLGNCSSKISAEHLVSAALFEGPAIDVEGFPWCKGESKRIGLGSFTANILCTKHNSELAALDQEAAETFRALRKATRLANTRKQLPRRRWNRHRHYVDGRRLEKWFLKTTVNLVHIGEAAPWPGKAAGDPRPPRPWLEVLFGRRVFPDRTGLYSAATVGETFDSTDTVRFAPLGQSQVLAGGLFEFRGLKLLLALRTLRHDADLRDWNIAAEWKSASLTHHLRKLNWEVQGHVSSTIEFRW